MGGIGKTTPQLRLEPARQMWATNDPAHARCSREVAVPARKLAPKLAPDSLAQGRIEQDEPSRP